MSCLVHLFDAPPVKLRCHQEGAPHSLRTAGIQESITALIRVTYVRNYKRHEIPQSPVCNWGSVLVKDGRMWDISVMMN